jgi:hypothetical protein
MTAMFPSSCYCCVAINDLVNMKIRLSCLRFFVNRAFCNLLKAGKLQNTQTSGRFSFFAYDLEKEKRSSFAAV